MLVLGSVLPDALLPPCDSEELVCFVALNMYNLRGTNISLPKGTFESMIFHCWNCRYGRMMRDCHSDCTKFCGNSFFF